MGLVGSTACLVDLSSNVPLQHVKKKEVFSPLCAIHPFVQALYTSKKIVPSTISKISQQLLGYPLRMYGLLVEWS